MDAGHVLEYIEANCLDIRCKSVPTGGGDYDVKWVVVEHYQQKPQEREIGRGDTPTEAVESTL